MTIFNSYVSHYQRVFPGWYAQWHTEGTEHHCVVFNEHGFPRSRPKAPSSKRQGGESCEIIEVLSSSRPLYRHHCIYVYSYNIYHIYIYMSEIYTCVISIRNNVLSYQILYHIAYVVYHVHNIMEYYNAP